MFPVPKLVLLLNYITGDLRTDNFGFGHFTFGHHPAAGPIYLTNSQGRFNTDDLLLHFSQTKPSWNSVVQSEEDKNFLLGQIGQAKLLAVKSVDVAQQVRVDLFQADVVVICKYAGLDAAFSVKKGVVEEQLNYTAVMADEPHVLEHPTKTVVMDVLRRYLPSIAEYEAVTETNHQKRLDDAFGFYKIHALPDLLDAIVLHLHNKDRYEQVLESQSYITVVTGYKNNMVPDKLEQMEEQKLKIIDENLAEFEFWLLSEIDKHFDGTNIHVVEMSFPKLTGSAFVVSQRYRVPTLKFGSLIVD